MIFTCYVSIRIFNESFWTGGSPQYGSTKYIHLQYNIWICYFPTVDQTKMSQFMRLWYLSHKWPAKAQASLRIHAVSPEPSLFADMKYGSRREVRPNIRHLAPLVGCACAFKNEFTGNEKYHNLMRWLKYVAGLFDILTFCTAS